MSQIHEELEKRIKWHHKGQRLWSLAHHGATCGAVILGLVVAALAQKTDWGRWVPDRDNLISLLSLLSATLAAVAVRGGFERKWLANRIARGRLDSLRLDLMKEDVSESRVVDRLKEIIVNHDAAVIGAELNNLNSEQNGAER